MTKKVNTGRVNTLATALQNAGVAASDIVVTSAPAAVDAQQQQQQQQPAPASPQAAIDATATLAAEIDAAKKVWEHAKASGISKDQFLTFCEIDPEKAVFFKTHKKAIFGGKKEQLLQAAQVVVDDGITGKNNGMENPKKGKKKGIVFCVKTIHDVKRERKELKKRINAFRRSK